MSVINIIGWETGTDNLEATLSGTAAITSAKANGGTYSLRVNPTTTGTGYAILQGHSTLGEFENMNLATVYIRFYIYLENIPANTEKIIEVRDTAGTLKGELRVQSDGTVRIIDSLPNAIATSSTALVADTWYRIEWLVPTGTSATSTLRINGAVDGSATGNFGTVNTGTFRLGKPTDVSGTSVDFYYDDICIKDDDWPNNGMVFALIPDGNGNYTAWTDEGGNNDASDWESADEIPHDSDTTYLKSSTNTNAETVTVKNLSTLPVAVHFITAVKSVAVAKAASTAANMQVRLRSGSTDDDTGNSAMSSAGYVMRSKVYTTDPATAAAWTVAGVNGVEVGVEHNTVAARELRCTLLCAMVDARPDLQSTSDLQSISSSMVTSRFSLTAGGIAKLHTINMISNNVRFVLGGTSNVITINSLASASLVSHIASGEIFVVGNINADCKQSLVGSCNIFTIGELSSNSQVSHIANAGINVVSLLESNANNLALANSNLYTITQLNNTAAKSISAISQIDTITQLGGVSQVFIVANFGIAIISEIFATGSSNGGLNTCEFITLSELSANASVSHLADGFICSINNLSGVGGLLHFGTVDLFTIIEIQSSARISMVVHAGIGSVGHLSSTGISTADTEEFLARLMAVVELQASPQVIRLATVDLSSLIILDISYQYTIGGQISLDTICIINSDGGFLLNSQANLNTIIVTNSTGSLIIPGQVLGEALLETSAELRAVPFIRDYTIFGDNEGLPFYVCIFYEDDFVVD